MRIYPLAVTDRVRLHAFNWSIVRLETYSKPILPESTFYFRELIFSVNCKNDNNC